MFTYAPSGINSDFYIPIYISPMVKCLPFFLLSLLQHQIKNTRGDGFQPSRTSKTVISVCCFFLTLGNVVNVTGLTIAIHMAFRQRFSFFLPLAGWKLLNALCPHQKRKKIFFHPGSQSQQKIYSYFLYRIVCIELA